MVLECSFVFLELRDEFFEVIVLHLGECVVVRGDYGCTTTASVDHGDLTKVISVFQRRFDELILTVLVSDYDTTLARTNKVH